jgi:transcriptional regulator with GAF, ATPase, and Fis domain
VPALPFRTRPRIHSRGDEFHHIRYLFDEVGVAGNAAGLEVMALEELERDYIERILNMTRWKVMGQGRAGQRPPGLKPTTLFYRMKKLGTRKSSKTA